MVKIECCVDRLRPPGGADIEHTPAPGLAALNDRAAPAPFVVGIVSLTFNVASGARDGRKMVSHRATPFANPREGSRGIASTRAASFCCHLSHTMPGALATLGDRL